MGKLISRKNEISHHMSSPVNSFLRTIWTVSISPWIPRCQRKCEDKKVLSRWEMSEWLWSKGNSMNRVCVEAWTHWDKWWQSWGQFWVVPILSSGFSCLYHLSPKMFHAYQFRMYCRADVVPKTVIAYVLPRRTWFWVVHSWFFFSCLHHEIQL